MPRLRPKAAVLHGVQDLRVEDSPCELPEEVPPGHARVAVKAVGICGSDVHYWCRGRIAHFVVTAPMVIGHESAGEVVGTGPGVEGLRPGDRVAMEPGVPCWAGRYSRAGRYNLDPGIKFFATPPVHGSLATYVDHPAELCYRLPESVSLEEGAMCEPLSVGVHACRRAGVQPGKKVAIMGAGPIGLVALVAARAFGADCVAIADLKPRNLSLAKQLGADARHLVAPGEAPEATAAGLRSAAGAGAGFDVVIDCAGFESTMRAALQAAAAGGAVVLVGMGEEEMRLPLVEASVREVDILGSFRYCNTYPACISLLASGRVDVKPLITHRYPFTAEGVAEGFAAARDADATAAVKVIFGL